jgi:ATP-dependent exoDNAse (exonuclease V) beta subunit
MEVPFYLKVEEDGTVKIVSGIVDLVSKEPQGWVIADYKTDIVPWALVHL